MNSQVILCLYYLETRFLMQPIGFVFEIHAVSYRFYANIMALRNHNKF